MNILKKIPTGKLHFTANYKGVFNKALFLFLVTVLSSLATLNYITLPLVLPTILLTFIIGFILLVISPKYLSYKDIAIPFSILEGLSLGAITYFINLKLANSGIYALLATFSSFVIMWLLYYFKIINVTDKFIKNTQKSLLALTVILFVLLLLLIFKLIVISPIILLILFIIVLVSGLCSLLVDFEQIKKAIEMKVEDKEEWGLAVSLLLSIVLIYQSFLQIFGIDLD